MSVEENKAVLRRIYEDIFNKGELELIPQTHAHDYVFHSFLGRDVKGLEHVKQVVNNHRNLSSDGHFEIVNMVGDENMVAVRMLLQGTITGSGMGTDTIGKQMRLIASYLYRFEDGKAKEMWDVYDRLTWFQQLGIAPPGYEIAKK
jgi:steroid delta-isomerase-like uncharacterized protein